MLGRRQFYAIFITAMIATTVITGTTTPFNSAIPTAHQDSATPATRNSRTPPPHTEWNRTYGGTQWDAAYSVQQTSDGGYILAGYTLSFGAGGYDFWLVKTDDTGNQQWNKTYGGTGDDYAFSVQQTSDGGYIAAGHTNSFGIASVDFWLVKTDSAGNQQWNKTYGGTSDDWAASVQQTTNGGYIIAGYTGSFGAGFTDFWLVKTDGSGDHQWNKAYGGAHYDEARSVQQTSDGGYILAGYTFSFGAGGYDFWLVKTDSAGKHQWNKTYGGNWHDYAYSVQQTSDGGYILAGYTLSFGAGGYDFWLVKIDSAGNHQWSNTYGGTGSDMARSVQQTSDGGYIVVGSTSSSGASGVDLWLVKVGDGTPARTTYGPQAVVIFILVIVLVIVVECVGVLLVKQEKSKLHLPSRDEDM